MPKFCPNCGTEISDKVKFCTECGADIDSFSVKQDSASLPLIKCFFYGCGVKTSKIYYCPLCGHDFCEKHKLHKDHYYGYQEKKTQPESKPVQPESRIPKGFGRNVKGFKKSHFAIAILIFAAVVTLAFFVLNLHSPIKGFITTTPSLETPIIPKLSLGSTQTPQTVYMTISPSPTTTQQKTLAPKYKVGDLIWSSPNDPNLIGIAIVILSVDSVNQTYTDEYILKGKGMITWYRLFPNSRVEFMSDLEGNNPFLIGYIDISQIVTKYPSREAYNVAVQNETTTQVLISESALKARIQDAKNKLDLLKESDKAGTIVYASPQRYGCDFKKSKELGYAIDCNSGDMFYVKGDYGRIDSYLFEENMIKGHTYVILHTHSGDWERCNYVDFTSYQSYYNTFSIADLELASSLTEKGYHIQKMIAVSDTNYEVYPKTRDGWKTEEEVYNSIDRIEKRMDVNFHFRDSEFSKTIYFVDSLMPLLTKELDYVYIQNNNIIS